MDSVDYDHPSHMLQQLEEWKVLTGYSAQLWTKKGLGIKMKTKEKTIWMLSFVFLYFDVSTDTGIGKSAHFATVCDAYI